MANMRVLNEIHKIARLDREIEIWRITETRTATGGVSKTNTSGNVFVALANSLSTNYTGDGTKGAYLYGFQLEAKELVTSYIDNTTIANTRAADTLAISSTTFDREYNNYSGTVFVDAQIDYRPTSRVVQNSRGTLVSFNDGTEANRVSLVIENQNSPAVTRSANAVVYSSGTLRSNTSIATANLTASLGNDGKVTAYFQRNGILGTAINGNVGGTDSGIAYGDVTAITIGHGPGTGRINGTISKIQYFASVSAEVETRAMTDQ
jgi:hypothetical protein